jgi:hypothetical protein
MEPKSDVEQSPISEKRPDFDLPPDTEKQPEPTEPAASPINPYDPSQLPVLFFRMAQLSGRLPELLPDAPAP